MKTSPDRRAAAATYRLQLNPSFRLTDAAATVPYLAALGVTHVYLSPTFEATRGSAHGYDVVDPTQLREELGGPAAFETLCAAAEANGLRLLLDVVPNHMAATDQNAWWRDVVALGESSEHAYLFDVDWAAGDGRVRRGPPREQINYRRFFEIDDLVALRQEDKRVFATTHTLVAELARHPAVDGLRVDHVDGLRDPSGYLRWLRAAAPDAGVVVEKILGADEVLPAAWAIDGTTGYEFATRALGLFVDPAALPALDALYVDLTGDRRTWPEAVRAGKQHALATGLAPDVARVARAFGDSGLADVITELAVEWPVYRTYTRPGEVSDGDAAVIETTCARVRALLPDRISAIERVEHALLRRSPDDEAADRFQMLTGPAMAKGVEDRAFYDYTRFVALNEVGGDPDAFGLAVDDWHAACLRTAEDHPASMLATATHDTKRGEDVRARLAAITERPDWWSEVASKWMARHDGIDGPTAYLLLQTLVGAWPVDESRLVAYMHKAVREAGADTTWASPDDAYERAVAHEVRAALDESELVDALVAPLIEPGRANALAQVVLRLTAPGVPDTYQGTEFWDLSLVDPDNRRPVDFGARAEALRTRSDPKLAVLAAGLEARRAFPGAFAGAYRPLETDNPDVVAYMRGDDVAVVVPLRSGARGDVALPPGTWTNRLPDTGTGLALMSR
jgi:(1->4)-alpha-D-glucan 1-alpha-D-glucosylmutase